MVFHLYFALQGSTNIGASHFQPKGAVGRKGNVPCFGGYVRAAIAVVVVLILLIILIVRAILRRIRRRKQA